MGVLPSHQEQLAWYLEKPLALIPDRSLELLARALVGRVGPGYLSCVQCQAMLPEYVEAEVGDYLDPNDDAQATVGQHLLLCPECGWRHTELLQITWLLSRGELPCPPHRPAPRLPLGGDFT